jgi:hypothetical protein
MSLWSAVKMDFTNVESFSIDQDEESTVQLLIPRVRSPPLNHSANFPPLRTTLAAVFMLGVGSIFLLASFHVFFTDLRRGSGSQGLAMIVLGMLSKFQYRFDE